MRLHAFLTASLMLGSVAPSRAQSFNVDIGATTVVPPSTYGAAANQLGVWNATSPTVIDQALPLVDLGGAVSPATLKRRSLGSSILQGTFNIPSTTGLAEMLLDDLVVPSPIFTPNGSIAEGYYQLDGLVPGVYDLYVYSVATGSGSTASIVTINGQFPLTVAGLYPGSFVLGQSHVIQTVSTTSGSIPFEVKSLPNTFNGWFNGLQIVLRGTLGTPFCTGDVVGTDCLGCGNNGAAGRGCANSSFAAGTLLTSSGLASLAADTLVLTGSDMPGPGLFFQADGLSATPASFGDGMLCASLGVLRMGVVFPTAGVAAYPGGLTPNPIHVAGAPIHAGDTKHYQCWYRDSVAFCTASTFNTSNGLTLTWSP